MKKARTWRAFGATGADNVGANSRCEIDFTIGNSPIAKSGNHRDGLMDRTVSSSFGPRNVLTFQRLGPTRPQKLARLRRPGGPSQNICRMQDPYAHKILDFADMALEE